MCVFYGNGMFLEDIYGLWRVFVDGNLRRVGEESHFVPGCTTWLDGRGKQARIGSFNKGRFKKRN